MVPSFLHTHTGKLINPLEMKLEDINIEDIARGLSNVCRFAGQCRFYSVAEHSCFVARYVPKDYAVHALLHDAAEAYIGDIPTPLKVLPQYAFYREAEERILNLVYKKFGLPPGIPPEVMAVDKRALVAEANELFSYKWDKSLLSEYGEPLPVRALGLRPSTAMSLFLDTFEQCAAEVSHIRR